MARAEIVAPAATGTVELRTKSLWIVLELWKNANGAFSHELVGRAQNARPHAPQGALPFLHDQDKNRKGKMKGRIACVRCNVA